MDWCIPTWYLVHCNTVVERESQLWFDLGKVHMTVRSTAGRTHTGVQIPDSRVYFQQTVHYKKKVDCTTKNQESDTGILVLETH